ncbi:MAG: TonB family protein [Pyrinomonadaceae bacterium]|nr:TonB family protein [Acidobacteriota bacterium]MDQ3491498.1 TonB family protein [Acidobacteriota bacterium]
MKLASNPRTKLMPYFTSISFFASIVLSMTFAMQAQQPQLTLADLLIGLRSKKVNVPERNAILAEAVKQRGVTFTLSVDIEKELSATGAAKTLLDAIREKAEPVKVSPAPPPVAAATPVPTPTPPDALFYQRRAEVSLGKGEFTLALADYNKAVELKADDAVAFLNRGKVHYNLKSFDKAVSDYDKSIELNPKGSVAYFNRGVSYEKMGNAQKAIVDYQRAVDLDAANETAKSNLKRLRDEELAKAVVKTTPPVALPAPEPAKAPESINMGNLGAASAVRMVTPVYSPIAHRSNIEGRVTVEVELNEKGEVVSAKAVSGHQLLRGSAEDAARKSKFKPAMFGTQAIKGTGSITYNFSIKPVK